jgi:DNA-binding response OmpR family regulator
VLDLAGQRLVGKGGEVALSAKEFQLLAYMVCHEGMVLSREALIAALWGPGYEGSAREVDVYVRYLRQKIEPEPRHPRYIITVWGVGYQYQGPRHRTA